jgi:hypothetical protein
MKRTGPAAINHARGVVTAIVRGTALVLITMGAYYLIKRVTFGIASGDIRSAFSAYMGMGEGHEVGIGLASVLVGTVLAVLSRTLARWVVVLAPAGCPQCAYPGVTAEMDRCPECGMAGFARERKD